MTRRAPSVPTIAWLAFFVVMLTCAVALPRSAAGGVGLVVLVLATGVGFAWARRRVALELPRFAPDALVALVVLTGAGLLFTGSFSESGLRTYDWGPHHANLANLVAGLKHGGVPRWVHGVSTGDSPYELYPVLPYWLMARAALLTNASDLTLVLVRTAIVTHTLAALGGGLLARRLTSTGWGALVGLAMLYDVGSVWGGGVDGLFKLGVLHAAMANAIYPFALVAVVEALRRPTLVTSLGIWVAVALAVACHPLALASALATCAALVLVALAARDVPAHRALACALHVALGVALVAWVFMPQNARLLAYGVHFGLAGQRAWEHFRWLTTLPIPQATLAPVIFAGNLGVVLALASRRAALMLLGGVAGLLLLFLLDQPYLLFDLIPSPEGSRFQTVRLASASKAAIYVLAAVALSLAWRQARSTLRERGPERGGLVLSALAALGIAMLLRAGIPYFEQLRATLRDYTHTDIPDEAGMQELARWAAREQGAMKPGRFARLMHEDDRRFYSVYHVNALSGLPTLWVGPVSCLFLRERIEDASPASLRRFDVRWVMRRDEPPSLGEPGTERRFGRYLVRELRDWDGAFARVERGSGQASVTRLENERIEVEVTGTEPSLVALGMGYYPRWQAFHDKLGALPVYAWPGIEGGKLRVPAAWLPPGHTTFRPTGALPSDARGRLLSFAALLAALGGVVAWRRPRARAFLLRRVARGLRWLAPRQKLLALAFAAAPGLGVLLAGIVSGRADAAALELGSGLRALASVESRAPGGDFRPCPYSAWYGAYRCRGALFVGDSTADLLNDAPPSPPFSVPAIVIGPSNRDAVVRLRVPARLAGEYWVQAEGGEVILTTDDGRRSVLGTAQQSLYFEPRAAPRELALEASVSATQTLKLAFVQRARLEPERGYLRAPETAPRR